LDKAQEIVSKIDNKEKRHGLQRYIDLYSNWKVLNSEGLRLLTSPEVPAEDSQKLLLQAENGYETIVGKLGLAAGDLPHPLTIFVYDNSEARQVGAGLVPLSPVLNGTLHIMLTEDPGYAIAQILPAYAWGKDTYSRLLRTGLAVALSRSKDDLVQQACALRSEGTWLPLDRVDFGVTDEKTIEIEAGLMLRYLLDDSVQKVREVWIATSPLGLYLSVDAALERVLGVTRKDIEKSLVSSVLICK